MCTTQQEYRRLEVLRKLAEADARTSEMTRRRQELIEQRRQAAIEVKQQRDTIANIMEAAKKNKVYFMKKSMCTVYAGVEAVLT